MINIQNAKDKRRLRRIALNSQGLLHRQAFGRGQEGALKAIQHIGYIQIDSISVVERAHNHVLFSRVPSFDPSMINTMLNDAQIFEYWSHAAAFLPIEDFRFSLPYKNAIKSGQKHWLKNPDRKLMKELLKRIEKEGPLRSRDLEDTRLSRSGWWDWKPAKKALEQLFMEGDLMVKRRDGFQKVYDLTERVLPKHVNTQTPTIEELAEHLFEQQLRANGLISFKNITYLRKNKDLVSSVKKLINERLHQGLLEQIQLTEGESYFTSSGKFDSQLPRTNKRISILSPFDNSVIQRDRLKSLFHYDYQIECYVPQQKRKYGYFSLPLLFGDTFIGRMDCKAHRKTRILEIKHLHFENHTFDNDLVIDSLNTASKDFCRFNKCDSISLYKTHPSRLLKKTREKLNTT